MFLILNLINTILLINFIRYIWAGLDQVNEGWNPTEYLRVVKTYKNKKYNFYKKKKFIWAF